MRHVLAATLAVCGFIGAGAPAAPAAVRHIAVNHSPAPPLRTVEIRRGNAVPVVVVTPPSSAQATCLACPPQNQTVQVDLVKIPL